LAAAGAGAGAAAALLRLTLSSFSMEFLANTFAWTFALPQRQYLYVSTSKASKLSTFALLRRGGGGGFCFFGRRLRAGARCFTAPPRLCAFGWLVVCYFLRFASAYVSI
jgi:hypothetical protein